MKTIFRYLLRKYSQTEKGRIEILRIMDDKVSDNYSEQTMYGNVYNYFNEFVIANQFIVKCALQKDDASLIMIKSGINKAFDEAIGYIKR